MVVDPQTENAYFASGVADIWKLTDWDKAQFRPCLDASPAVGRGDSRSGPRSIAAADVAIDSRNRFLFTRQNKDERVYRWTLDGEHHEPAPVGKTGSAIYSDKLVMNEWPGSLYMDRGMWPSLDGGMLTLSGTPPQKHLDVHLYYHPIDPVTGPGKSYVLTSPGTVCGGVRMDLQGNIYLGVRLPDDAPKPPAGYASDWTYANLMGRIVKYAPTRLHAKTEPRRGDAESLASDRLCPAAPAGPAKVYDVHYGHMSRDSSQVGFTPRFGVDGYGRIVYPNTLTQTVALMDNAGNEILRFGTYGNIDDWRALEGQWAEAKVIPLSWPGAVDATDGWIYVADHANVGVLRLRRTWTTAETAPFR